MTIRKQDEDLEGLGKSVQRLGDMGKSINEELVDQVSKLTLNCFKYFNSLSSISAYALFYVIMLLQF